MTRHRDGTVYVSLSNNHVIGTLCTETLKFTLLAGKMNERGHKDGTAEESRFSEPK